MPTEASGCRSTVRRSIARLDQMRKFIALTVLGLVLMAGTVTVLTLSPQPAMADGSGNGGGQ